MSRPHPVYVGERFSYLTVIETGHRKGKVPSSLCRCDCGNEKVFRNTNLRTGYTRSCGCMSQKLKSMVRQIEADPGCRVVSLTDTSHNANDCIGSGVRLPRGMSSAAMI